MKIYLAGGMMRYSEKYAVLIQHGVAEWGLLTSFGLEGRSDERALRLAQNNRSNWGSTVYLTQRLAVGVVEFLNGGKWKLVRLV